MKGIESIRESFKTKQVKYGGYAALITLAVIVGLILVNLLAGQLSLQIDLTSSKIYSLSEQTLKVLETVNTPVKFYGLWRPGEERPDVINVINLYLSKNKNISLDVLDPDRNPGFVAKYDKEKKGVPRGSLIVEGSKGYRIINPYDMYDITQNRQGQSSITGVAAERRITSALLYAGTGNTPIIYELTGHGEVPLSSFNMVDLVERENFTLKTVNLLVSPVPSDASSLILNNPQRDLTEDEAVKILDYLEKGGRLLILADYNTRELTNLNVVLASYGVELNYGIVMENDPNYSVAVFAFSELPDVLEHDITKPLMNKSQTPVFLLGAMSVSTLDTKRRTVEVKPLLSTSPTAILRTDLNNSAETIQPGDIRGPHILGAAVMDPSWLDPNNPEPQARIVIIGSGSLLNIAMQGFDANRDLFMNSVTWLENRPETISVRSKSLFLLPMRLNLLQIVIFGSLFILIIPLAFFITGLVTWLKRRHL